MSVSYEVTAQVRADLCREFEEYMCGMHIPQVMATGAFASAAFERIEEGRYRTRYNAAERARLDQYLSEHSPRLREDVSKHFPGGIEFSREIWAALANF